MKSVAVGKRLTPMTWDCAYTYRADYEVMDGVWYTHGLQSAVCASSCSETDWTQTYGTQFSCIYQKTICRTDACFQGGNCSATLPVPPAIPSGIPSDCGAWRCYERWDTEYPCNGTGWSEPSMTQLECGIHAGTDTWEPSGIQEDNHRTLYHRTGELCAPYGDPCASSTGYVPAKPAETIECHGACCYSDGGCTYETEAECAGAWQGEGTDCVPNLCPPPLGACCHTYGEACDMLSQADCILLSGTWLGAGAPCPAECVPLGACCTEGNTCTQYTSARCVAQDGVWQGSSTTCDPNPCLPAWQYCCQTFRDEYYCETGGYWGTVHTYGFAGCSPSDISTPWAEVFPRDPTACVYETTVCMLDSGCPIPGFCTVAFTTPDQPVASCSCSSSSSSSSTSPSTCAAAGCAVTALPYPLGMHGTQAQCLSYLATVDCVGQGYVPNTCGKICRFDSGFGMWESVCCYEEPAVCPTACDGVCATTYMATIGAGSTCCQFMQNYFVLSWETQNVQLDRAGDCYWLGGQNINIRMRVYTVGPCPNVSNLISDSTDPAEITLNLTCYNGMWQIWMSWNSLPCPPPGDVNGGVKAPAACPVGSYTNGFAVAAI